MGGWGIWVGVGGGYRNMGLDSYKHNIIKYVNNNKRLLSVV